MLSLSLQGSRSSLRQRMPSNKLNPHSATRGLYGAVPAPRSTTSRCPRQDHQQRPQDPSPGIPAHMQQQSTQSKQLQYEELDAALDVIGVGRSHFLVLSCISLVWAGDAAEVMVLSYLGPAAACGFGLTSANSQSLLASAVFVGMLLGAAVWGFVGDTLGRKPALAASSAVVVAAGLCSAAAPTPTLLLISRALVGFGLAGSPIGFTLMTELLPPRSRSVWGTLIELAWTAGTVAEAALAWAVLSSQGWRLLLLLSAVPLVVLLLLVRWLPESPRFLLSQGHPSKAADILQHMASMNGKQHMSLPIITAAAAATAMAEEEDLLHQPVHQQQQQQQQQQQEQHGSVMMMQSPRSSHEQQLLLELPAYEEAHDHRQCHHEDRQPHFDQQQQRLQQQPPKQQSKTSHGAALSAKKNTSQQVEGLELEPQQQQQLSIYENQQNQQNQHSQQNQQNHRNQQIQQQNQQQQNQQQQALQQDAAGQSHMAPDSHRSSSSAAAGAAGAADCPSESPSKSESTPLLITSTSHQQQQQTPHQQHQSHQYTPKQQQQQQGKNATLSRLKYAARSLFLSGSHARETGLILVSWVAVAFAYYGLVQLAAEVHLQAAAAPGATAGSAGGADQGAGPVCVNGMLHVPSSDYAAVMAAAAAEVPAVAWAASISKVWGGRTALVASLLLGGACLLPSVGVAAGAKLLVGLGGGPAAAAAGGAGPHFSGGASGGQPDWMGSLTDVTMFGSRLFVSAAFALLWVFTPSHFPTRVRGLGLGLSNACGRIGGLLSPFAAINLALAVGPTAAEALFAGVCLTAAGAVLLTPHGQAVKEEQMEEEEEVGDEQA